MTFLKFMGLVLSFCTMVGFGICGVCGLGYGMKSSSNNSDFVVMVTFGLVGIAISVAAFFSFRAILRSLRSK